MPSADSTQAGRASVISDPQRGDVDSQGIPLQALAAAEAGQAGVEEAFAKMLSAAKIQQMDYVYRAVRVYPEAIALASFRKADLVHKCYMRACAAFKAHDEEALPQVLDELCAKVDSQRKSFALVCDAVLSVTPISVALMQKWQAVEALPTLSHRDHLRLAQCLSAREGIIDEMWSGKNGEWRKVKPIPKVEDLARSAAVAFKDRIPPWLAWLLPEEEIEINGRSARSVNLHWLSRVIASAIILGPFILFATPIVLLAMDAFSKQVNVAILILSAMGFFIFLVWWITGQNGQNTDNLVFFLLAYTAVLGNINLGGK
ncbi:unnamed protein product [Clonostachys chloroleuca]|uniref:Uncharacterized protein n=1 Tax=Clonostachys chloroleuca TaxID=1926264 RepID=A0AA35MHX3_9HYPO|nr:unnamed protein product [Clonostachys chloroleuca]